MRDLKNDVYLVILHVKFNLNSSDKILFVFLNWEFKVMMSIQTNVSVLDSLGHLKSTRTGLTKSVGSVSSGKRINNASDDGAGLSVATRLEADKTSLTQARRNINDALGLMQTAEGTLDTLTGIVIRFRELSVQALNETYTADDRRMMLTEMQDLNTDWRRIASESEYNGIAVTNSTDTISFQVSKDGSDADAISVNLSRIRVATITAFSTVGATALAGTAASSSSAATNLSLLDSSLDQLGQMRARVGSMQNRLSTAIDQSSAENSSLQVAQGRILDVNYASETANMTRLEMQREVSIASLSQAKNIPTGLLSLLN